MNIFILNQLLYTRTSVSVEDYTELLLAESISGTNMLFEEINSDPLLTNAFFLVDEENKPLLYEGTTTLVVAD